MSRNGSGTYNLPAGNPVVTGTTISSTWANTTLSDIASALTGSVASDGQTPMSANLNMATNKVVNVADPSNTQDAATKNYVDTLGLTYQPTITSIGILKGSGAGSISAAVAGTDYCSATSGSSVLKGSSGSTTAATAGTDYVAPGTATSFTALQTFSGSSSVAALKTTNIKEVITVSATAATGTINYDITTQSVLYYTTNASGNWTVNFRGSSGTSLNTLMSTGESMSVTFMVTQGSTAYYNSVIQVDGNSITPKWQNGATPSSGNINGIDIYNYVIIKTGSATFTVLASQTQFK